MSNMDKYIEKVKAYQKENPDLSETELIRYVYIELGKRFSFNINFLPFGNTKNRQRIYGRSTSKNILEECMETNVVTCKSVSYILEYILKAFDVNIKAVKDPRDNRKCPHVYNIIIPKNGEEYSIDLQADMYSIQSHSFTKNFGLSTKDGSSYIISRYDQEQMDRKLGYIDDKNYYADSYLDLIKTYMLYIKDFGERVKFVLENIEIYDNPNMGYSDREWSHVSILEELFSKEDFNYQRNNRRIRMIDCFKDVNGKRHYLNCIAVQTKSGTDMYVYNKNKNGYSKIELKDFARAVKNGLVVHNCTVPGLRGALKNLKQEER